MKIINRIEEMQKLSLQWRKEGKIISFVPTMGFLHKGHLSLMEEGKKRGNLLVISIFVNPIQFGVGEDFEKYPRDLEKDKRLADEAGVDIIFAPSASEMYPEGGKTFVEVETITNTLCGISRPHHFRGVTTVVAKLFNIIKPHRSFFGKKDFQQLVVIQRMVKDLNMDIEVIGLPIIREKDGLAMSSRNTYLSKEERGAALSLNRSLHLAEMMYKKGIRKSKEIIHGVEEMIGRERLLEIEYIKICDRENLNDVDVINCAVLLALAVKAGKTRLIDNYEFDKED